MSFQLTAARRRLPGPEHVQPVFALFQLTAARRRLLQSCCRLCAPHRFNSQPLEGGCRLPRPNAKHQFCFNSQPLEGGCDCVISRDCVVEVFQLTAARRRLPKRCKDISARESFNSQPPEGDCLAERGGGSVKGGFNSQPPEGGCVLHSIGVVIVHFVSTHSRPKAAAQGEEHVTACPQVSTHSRPKAAAPRKKTGRRA